MLEDRTGSRTHVQPIYSHSVAWPLRPHTSVLCVHWYRLPLSLLTACLPWLCPLLQPTARILPSHQVASSISTAEGRYAYLKSGVLDTATLIDYTERAQTLANQLATLATQAATLIPYSAGKVSFSCAATTSISVPTGVSFSSSTYQMTVQKKQFTACTAPTASSSFVSSAGEFYLDLLPLMNCCLHHRSFSHRTDAPPHQASLSADDLYIKSKEFALIAIKTIVPYIPTASEIGSLCNADFGITLSFGASGAAVAGTGVSVGFAFDCDGSKVVFSPMWTWQVGDPTITINPCGHLGVL